MPDIFHFQVCGAIGGGRDGRGYALQRLDTGTFIKTKQIVRHARIEANDVLHFSKKLGSLGSIITPHVLADLFWGYFAVKDVDEFFFAVSR